MYLNFCMIKKKKWIIKCKNLRSYRERLEKAIDRYEKEFVNPTISDINKFFALQIVFHILLITFGILTNLKPSLSSIIGALGLGSLGFSANWQRLEKTFKQFLRDRRILKLSVAVLRIELELCGNDEKCLKNRVETLLRRYQQEVRKTPS